MKTTSHTFTMTIALFAATTLSYAQQTGATSTRITTTPAQVEAFWNPSRILSATSPMTNPAVGTNGLPTATAALVAPDNKPPVQVNGAGPASAPDPILNKTIVPAFYLEPSAPLAGAFAPPSVAPIPSATSSFGAFFTTSRVFPDATTLAYPYITAGKLFFTDPHTGGNFQCSASVLRQRLVVTAGHCVASPSTNPAARYFYSNFMFVPAYNGGSAPLGVWTPNFAGVTNDWYFSDGSVPNPQDVGMLIMNDQGGRKISFYTGFLGYRTLALATNNVTMLGYPCNLDSCLKMQGTYAQTFASGGNNTYTYGSAMRGGASGGPWIQDFGVNPVSNPPVSLGLNFLVAVTSYGPVATTPMYLGASQLDSRFTNLLTVVCGSTTNGNCN
jgi:V8-like Glu-specific endopeptidase